MQTCYRCDQNHLPSLIRCSTSSLSAGSFSNTSSMVTVESFALSSARLASSASISASRAFAAAESFSACAMRSLNTAAVSATSLPSYAGYLTLARPFLHSSMSSGMPERFLRPSQSIGARGLASRPTSSRTSFMAFCSWAMFLRPSSEAMEALTLAQAAEASSAETALSAIARTVTDWKFGARAWRATRETTWRSMTECSITRVASDGR
mmetsp:Transcript_100/g.354  ORF Transcript_100/g.354 Transcript_100/m.354 type:complete len:209 (-) Transcript_100:8-634(-)